MKITYHITTDCHGYKIIWRDQVRHAHLRDMRKVRILLHLIDINIMPKDPYLQESCRRLLTDEEYSTLKQPKEKYRNVPRRMRG